MRIVTASATDTGLLRDANEDSLFAGNTVFGVADGLGGHAAGEVASALAVERLTALDGREFKDPPAAGEALAGALREANRTVRDAAAAAPERSGMGTTLTAATITGGQLVIAHVGDSRAYLLRPRDGLQQLTVDHTAVGLAVREGVLTPEEGERHPQRHMLLQAIGLDTDVQVEVPPPVPVAPGDRVLLCSDGLTEVVSKDEIAAILARDEPEAASRGLIETALARGGPDNITVIVVGLEADPAD